MTELQKERMSELEHILALDIESAGTDPTRDEILEIAAVFGRIRDGVFSPLASTQFVLPVVSDVRDWHPKVVEMHAGNGLLAESLKLTRELNEAQRTRVFPNDPNPWHAFFEVKEKELIGLATQHRLDPDEKWTLLGNSVHFDLSFLRSRFHKFSKMLSHRVFDISANRLFCESLGRPYTKGEPAHRAMPDVQESLRYFAEQRDWAINADFLTPGVTV